MIQSCMSHFHCTYIPTFDVYPNSTIKLYHQWISKYVVYIFDDNLLTTCLAYWKKKKRKRIKQGKLSLIKENAFIDNSE